MGFLLASMFGARRRVYDFGENESKTSYYIVSTIANMWLADAGLNEIHHFIAPRADVVRLEDGPRGLTGIDKGRWFVVITDEAPDQDGWMGYKKLYCNSEARARGIHEDAERIRGQSENKQIDGLSQAQRVQKQITHSERSLKEIEAWQLERDRKWAEDQRRKQQATWLERRSSQWHEDVVRLAREEMLVLSGRCADPDIEPVDAWDWDRLQILLEASSKHIDLSCFDEDNRSRLVFAERYAIEAIANRPKTPNAVVKIAIQQLDVALQLLALATSKREDEHR